MSINGNLDEIVVVDTNQLEWTPSPSGSVLRKRLHLVGPEESGQVTGLVQFQPGANFPAHEHPEGEEFFVLDGVFSDDSGDYGPGSYLLNPEGFAHGPSSEEGCTIFVKLRQYPGTDRPHIVLDTNEMPWEGSGTIGVVQKTLYRDNDYPEAMSIEKWEPDTVGHLQIYGRGAEILVIDGELKDEAGTYTAGTWMRFPAGHQHTPSSDTGCLLYVKLGGVAVLKSAA